MDFISPRPLDQKSYILPYFNQPISTNVLKTSQIALVFSLLISGVGSFYLSSPKSLFSGGACIISSLSLLGSFFMIKKAPSLPTATLQTVAVELQEAMR